MLHLVKLKKEDAGAYLKDVPSIMSSVWNQHCFYWFGKHQPCQCFR